MRTSRPRYRFALAAAHLVLSAVLLAFVSNAGASEITYNIVDYPANEADVWGGNDTISGTIVTDGSMGPLSATNITLAGPFHSRAEEAIL